MKSKRLNYYSAIFLLLTVLLAGCKKDEDTPAYVGTWTTEEPATIFTYKTTLVIEESTFTYTESIKIEGMTEWIVSSAFKGNLSVSGNEMTIDVTSIGEAIITINGSTIEGTEVEWYNKGTSGYSELLDKQDMSSVMKLQFTISGNAMTIIPDYDNDGTLDTEETAIYTKE